MKSPLTALAQTGGFLGPGQVQDSNLSSCRDELTVQAIHEESWR